MLTRSSRVVRTFNKQKNSRPMHGGHHNYFFLDFGRHHETKEETLFPSFLPFFSLPTTIE